MHWKTVLPGASVSPVGTAGARAYSNPPKAGDQQGGTKVTYVNDLLLKAMIGVRGLAHRLREERGQDLMEYALLGGFIAVVFAAAAILLPLSTFFNTMVGAIGECADMDAVCP
jgi:Flp pilus assembly pilin Flp